MQRGFKAGAKVTRMRTPDASELIDEFQGDAGEVALARFMSAARRDDVKLASDWLSVMQDVQHHTYPKKRKFHA